MDDASARKYHVAHQGRKFGPLSLVELSSRRLSSDMLVWCEGMPEWVPISAIAELRAYVHHATASHTVAPPAATLAAPPMPATSSFPGKVTASPPAGAPPSLMPPPPPTPSSGGGGKVKFIAISMIVLGTLGLLCCPISAVGTFFQEMPVDVGDAIDISAFATGRAVVFGLTTAISVAMLAGGIGVLYRRRWGALTCLVASIACVVTYLLAALFECGFFYAPLTRLAQEADADPESVGFVIGFIASAGCAWIFGLIWHSIMIVLLNSKSVRESLR